MKKYLLDTNMCIHFLKGEYDLDLKIDAIGIDNCYISEITLAELQFGVENSAESRRADNQANVDNLELAFDSRVVPIRTCFALYAKEKARLRRIGRMISEFDMLIACSAVSNGMIMVTRNVGEFNRIEGIEIENWIDS